MANKKAITRLFLKDTIAGREPNRLYYSETNTYRGEITGSVAAGYVASVYDNDTDELVTSLEAKSRQNASKLLVGQLSALGVGFAVKPKGVTLNPPEPEEPEEPEEP